MKRIATFFLDYRVLLLLIYLLLLQYFFLRDIIVSYQISDRELYVLGSKISKGIVYLGLVLSLSYPLIVKLQKRYIFREKLLFVLIGLIPAVYHIVLYILSIFSK